MAGATPADPQVHATPLDPNAAEAITPPSQLRTPGVQEAPYIPAAGTPDPETPAKPTPQTVKEELGGPSSGAFVAPLLKETGHPAPTQGGDQHQAAPGTLSSGGDNVATAYDGLSHGATKARPSNPDPETPAKPVASTKKAPYLKSSIAQEPSGH